MHVRRRRKIVHIGFLTAAFIAGAVVIHACTNEEPLYPACPQNSNRVSLDTVLVDPTEVWLKVAISSGELTGTTLRLTRNDRTIFTRLITAPLDTTLMDQSLEPNKAYRYRAFLGRVSDTASSRTLQVTTMGTTSSMFTWKITTLGVGLGGNILQDVAILNDTCVYAVGELHLLDSSGQLDPMPYNLARWDGNGWKVERLAYRFSPRVSGRYPGGLRTIFALGPSSLLVSQGSMVRWYDGSQWSDEQFLFDQFHDTGIGGINKFWGTSSREVWGVGDKGTIFSYDGTNWTQIQSGTKLDIEDIYGAMNEHTGEVEVLAVASKFLFSQERNILKIMGATVIPLSDSGIKTSLTGVCFVPGRRYYVTGDGIFTKRILAKQDGANSSWKRDPGSDAASYYKTAIRMTGINDVIIAGRNGTCLHFNGRSWKSFYVQTHLTGGHYYRVAIRGNLVVAVGDNNGKGVIAMGRR